MKEITQNYNLEWPKNSPSQITATLDSFLSTSSIMPQAYLFLGSSDLGSSSFQIVKTFAQKITDSKVLSNVDTVFYDAAINGGVEAIREVLSLAALMPVSSRRKAVVMLNMHKASVQVLNTLLKTLEEPPAHSTFLLLSESPLLPTVMSRCQVFSLHYGENGNMETQKTSEELTEALKLLSSHRSAGQAERMVLVNELAGLEDGLLPQLLQSWLVMQVAELKTAPQKYPAVRATTEALLSLRGNFNKKMILQQFVTSGLL